MPLFTCFSAASPASFFMSSAANDFTSDLYKLRWENTFHHTSIHENNEKHMIDFDHNDN
jgi:hypothetical protein